MKAKLLRKLRRIGRDKVTIYSITTTNGVNTGMSIGFNESAYAGLFRYGDSEEDVKKKAEKIYLTNYLDSRYS